MDFGTLKDLTQAFQNETGLDRTDLHQLHYAARQAQNLEPDSSRFTSLAANYRPSQFVRDLTGTSNPTYRRMREERGLGLEPTAMGRLGQAAGIPVRDVLNDDTRSWWWLLNAPQAVTNVIAEKVNETVAPELYGTKDLGINITEEAGRRKALEDNKAVQRNGQLKLRAGVQKDDLGNLRERRVKGGHAAALLFPQGFALNTALGLMTPFGGATGYEAAIPDANDPTKTANVLAEVGAKYFLGRTGNLLDYDEFKKVRPDVSRSEYNAYKAFKYDKKGDYDLSDGDFTLPMGVLKGTTDGIHGAELQFLGRSLPLTTAGVPVAASIAGGALAGAMTRNRNHVFRNMLAGTTASTLGGMALGNVIEGERQRRNMRENERKTTALDPESTTVGF